ncbi:MAG: LysE family translocator [Geminicoccaceae bacterium]
MTDLLSLFSTGLAFFVVAVSPGPANISNATIAMSRGRKASLVYACGLTCGLAFWGVIAASGLGAVLQGSLHLLMILKILGGLYLLWLAILSARSAWRPAAEGVVATGSSRWFMRGLILNLSNPKSVIAWMAALAVGLDPSDNIGAVVAATAVCIGVGFLTNALYSIFFSIDGVMQGYRRVRRWIDGAAAALFAMAGFGLIRSAFVRSP